MGLAVEQHHQPSFLDVFLRLGVWSLTRGPISLVLCVQDPFVEMEPPPGSCFICQIPLDVSYLFHQSQPAGPNDMQGCELMRLLPIVYY